MTTQTKTLMQGEAKLNLMAFTDNVQRFQNLINKDTLIDAKLSILTCEGEVVAIDVSELLQLQFEAAE
ncbi:hypothetical protein ACT8ZR_18225 [Neobacillus sp. M.A.Huq-85]